MSSGQQRERADTFDRQNEVLVVANTAKKTD